MTSFTVDEAIYLFVNFPSTIITTISLSLTIVILSRLKDPVLFLYLKYESIFILFDCFVFLLIPIYKCQSCFPNLDPYMQHLIDYFGFNFFSDIFETSSLFMSNFAALSCLFVMKSNQKTPRYWSFLIKINPLFIAIGVFAYSFLINSYQIFAYFQIDCQHDMNSTWIDCNWFGYFKSPPYNALMLASFILDYGILVLILIFINGLIVIKIRRSLGEKSIVLKTVAAKRKTTERKLTKLILVDCLVLIVGRFPFLLYLIDLTIDSKGFDSPYASLSNFLLIFTFNIKFFFFFKLNSRFKDETIKVFLNIKTAFKRVIGK